MMAPTHALTGVSAYVGIAAWLGLPIDIVSIAAAFLGSLLPDIDHHKSWVGRRLFFLSVPIQMIFGHRGVTHSLLAMIAIGAVACWRLTISLDGWLVALLTAYLFHLLGDWVTGGVPLLWPRDKTYRAPFYFNVGGIVEKFVFILLAIGLGYIFVETNIGEMALKGYFSG